jgi:Ca-activated chloride channel family protein
MSFRDPIWLLVLLVIPAFWLLYRARRARAARFAVRFPAAATLSLAAPAVAAWRRHLPALLAVAAMVPLAVALARPERSVSLPIDRASIVLVTDHSGSMNATDVEPSRLVAAKKAANTFIDELPARVRLGAVTYAGGVDAVQAPDTNHKLARNVIDGQVADGATGTGDALKSALDLLRREAKNSPSAIVLLSDGANSTGSQPTAVARQSGASKRIPIYTVALGTDGAVLQTGDPFQPEIDVSPDRETLAAIARVSGGKAFNANDSGKLEGIYSKLGSRLGTRKSKRELTAGFAAAGLVLLLGAGIAGQMRPPRIT